MAVKERNIVGQPVRPLPRAGAQSKQDAESQSDAMVIALALIVIGLAVGVLIGAWRAVK